MRVLRGGAAVTAFLVASAVGVAAVPRSLAATQSRLIWKARYDGKLHGGDVGIRDAVSPDGSKVFTTGQSLGSNVTDYVTIGYEAASGTKIWTARYDGPAHGEDDAWGVVTSPDGSKVFVTGQSYGGSTGFDYATVAYDSATGKQLWASRYNGPGNGDDITISLGVSPDGSLMFVTGTIIGTAGNQDFGTVAYDTVSGNQVWVARYDGPGHGDDAPGALTVGPNGRVYVMGGSQGVGTGFDVATIAYKGTTGKKLWVARYDGPVHGDDGNCVWTCVETSPDGSQVYVLAQGPGDGTGSDIVTIAYDAVSGGQDWAVRYNGPGNGDDYPSDLAVVPDGSAVVISGVQTPVGSSFFDIVTTSYEPSDGSQQWLSTYDGPSHGQDFPDTIDATSNSQAVVLTGASNNDGSNDGAGQDMLTLAYATADGQQQWVARYDGPGHGQDLANFVTLSPDGDTAYVTGESTGKNGSLDYATLAYRVT
jgi:hypothetical protein